jgi:hypothetical protein
VTIAAAVFITGSQSGLVCFGDQHFARLEGREVVRIRHDTDLTRGDLLADRTAGRKHRTGAFE